MGLVRMPTEKVAGTDTLNDAFTWFPILRLTSTEIATRWHTHTHTHTQQ